MSASDTALFPPSTLATAALAVVGALMCTFIAISPWLIRTYDFAVFIPCLMASGLLIMLATHLASRVPTAIGLVLVLGLGLLMRWLALLPEPLLSTDTYRYVWDGRVQAAGINPYRYVPADTTLTALRDTAVYPNINRADYAITAYPPVAQVYFFLVTRFSETVTGMRVGMIGCESVIVLVMIGLLRRLGQSPVAIVAWVWHPLCIWEIANNGHVEVLMAALVMLGVWLGVLSRATFGGISVALAALVKPYALVVSPALWRPWDWRLPAAMIATIAVCYAPYLGVGWGVLGFVTSTGYLAEEGHVSGQGFWLVALVRQAVGPVPGLVPLYLAGAAAALAVFGWRVANRPDPSTRSRLFDVGWLVIAGLLVVSPNYPWYFLVVVPFIVLGIGAPAWALSLGALLLYRPLILPAHELAWKSLSMLPFIASVLWLLVQRRDARRASDADHEGVPR